jgi:tetratricopeptide (TPR) repeat protein
MRTKVASIPDSFASLFIAVVGCRRSGRLAEAVALYDRILLLRPDLPEAHCDRADALTGLGRPGEAEEALRRAIALRPQFGEAFSNLGNALKEQGRLGEAEAACRQAIALKPDFADAYNNLAIVLLALGKLDDAEKALQRAIVLRPKFGEAFSNLGHALKEQGRLAEAEAACRQAIALKPDFPDDYSNLAIVLLSLGRLDDAEKALRRAIALDRQFARAFSNLGNVLTEQGRLGEAEAACRQAIALKPDFADAYNNLAIVLSALGKLDDAEKTLRHAIALDRKFAQAFSNLGDVLTEQGSLGEAEAACRQAIALKPDLANAYNNLAIVLLGLGKLDDAEIALRRAIALRPQFGEAFSNLGNALKEQRRPVEAEAACRQAIALKPDFAEAYSNLGNALKDQDRPIEAEAVYRRAIMLKPRFADAYNNLGMILKDLGRMTEAHRAVEQAIQMIPQKARYYFNLSELRQFGAGDQYLAAMERLYQSSASLSVTQQIELHFALAKAYEDVGRRDDSFQQLLAGNALKRRQIAYDEIATLEQFERIRAVFTAERLQMVQGVGEPSSVPLFIVGMPRSGTTLIEQILASHPQVFGAGELSNLGNAAASIRPTGESILAFPEVMLNTLGEHLQRLGARYVSDITQLAPTARHVTDKMPSNFLFVGLIHLALPNARIIHAVRDPVDTCMSCFSKLFNACQNFSYDLAELGRYYRHYQAMMEHWHRVLPPGRILDVRYEDLVADLEGQARRIIVHCGLQWDTRCLTFHETERPVYTASATQVRRPIYRSSIGRWRAYEPVLWPLLAELFEGVSKSPLGRDAPID